MLPQSRERTCFATRRHGVVLARPFLQAAGLALVGAGLLTMAWPVSALGVPALVAAALVAVSAVWRWERTKIVLTTQQLLIVHGTLRQRAAAVRLEQVGAIEVEQSLLGRLLGYGTILAGELEIAFVPEPKRIYWVVQQNP